MTDDLPSTYGYSELIHPDKFAIKTDDLHMGNIDDAADALELMGTALVNQVTSAHGAWTGLPAVYEAPEAAEFYQLLDAPLANAEAFNTRMTSAAGHLRDWADVVGRERPNLTDLEEEARTFHDEVSGGVETVRVTTAVVGPTVVSTSMIVTIDWDEDQATWERNVELWDEYIGLHTIFQEADLAAADAILALREVDTRLPGQPGGPEPENPGEIPEMPWGDIVRGGQAELIMAQVFLEQVGPLFGYNPFTGEFSLDLAGEAWTGVWNGVVDLVTLRPEQVAAFAVEQFVARTTGGYVEFDPDDQAHRVFDGLASSLTIDLFSDDPLSQWAEDPAGAAASLQLLGISVLAGGPVGSAATAGLSMLGRTLLRHGSVIVGNVRFWVDGRGLHLTNLLDGSTIRPPFHAYGPDGETALRNFLELYEQRHGSFDGPDRGPDGDGPDRGPDGEPANPGTVQPGTQVVIPDGERPPRLVSQSEAPSRWDRDDVQSAWENAYRNEDGVRVDPRTGAPLVGGPPTPGTPRRWVMYWDDANNQWVAGNRGAGWGDSRPPVPADTFDPDRGDRYDSGDAHLPGDHPPGRVPPATTATTSGETGTIHIGRGDRGIEYQMQISGYRLTDDGLVPEYQLADPETGQVVRFDGHTFRGEPPVEVFLEAKDGYAVLGRAPYSDRAQGMTQNLLDEAERQLEVLPDGAILEWHVSDPVGAAAIRQRLVDADIEGIRVIYTPKP